MRPMSFVNVGIIGPGCPARRAAARLRRAFVRPILAAPPVRATQPLILLQISVKAFSHGMSTCLSTNKEPHTKQKKNFPLELRTKTICLTSILQNSCYVSKECEQLKKICWKKDSDSCNIIW